MYAWIWRKLPFGFWGKLTGSLGLAVATTALLWYVVFPWATPLLPFDDVQVEGTSQDAGNNQNGPDAVTPTDPDANAPDDIPYSTESNQPHPSSSPTPKKSKTPSGSTEIPGD
jgi:cytoskeletal protein RodZ